MTTGPTWAWTIRSVERKKPMTGDWEMQNNRTQNDIPFVRLAYTRRPRTAVIAYFPSGGMWRVTLDVQAVWISQELE